MTECPGRFKCHGPASWCDQCGDVDLVCDDPRCMVHARFKERQRKRDDAFMAWMFAQKAEEEARRAYHDAAAELERYTQGNPVMVARRR